MRSIRRVIVVVLLVQVGWMAVAGFLSGFHDIAFAVGFGGGALAALAVLLGFVLVWQRTDARRARLLRTGTRVPAVLVASRDTKVVIRNRRLRAHTFETGAGIRAVAHSFDHPPVGTPGTVAYDPSDSRQAVVVEEVVGEPHRP